jgi:hypothetical protein
MGQPDLQFHQILKDLQWIFSSPPLTEANQYSFEQPPLDQHWLNTITQSPEKISGFMADKNLRMLGPYFEALWEFYFLNYPGKKLIAKNLQVFSGNKTIGEFDFIYLDEATGEYRHLEVAIKYFLGFEDLNARTSVNSSAVNSNAMNCSAINSDGDINKVDKSVNDYSPMSQWLGPNANDRLDKKYIKMQEQQSQLSQTTEGKATLEKLNVLSSKIKPEICLLGYLFYPLDEDVNQEQMLAPQNSHISHNKGYWLKVGQIEKYYLKGVYGK